MSDASRGTAEKNTPEPTASAPSRWRRAVVREVRDRPMAYGVLIAFSIAGPFVVPYLFPGATPGLGFVGGLLLGTFAALCAVPGKFL